MTPLDKAERLRMLDLLAEEVDLAMFFLSPEGLVETWNPGAERLKGYTAGEIVGQHFSRFYTPEDVAAGEPERLLQEARDQGRAKQEGWRVRKDGSRFWADVVITALHDSGGKLQGFAKITRDLTERMRAETQVRLAREELSITLHSIGDALIATDREGRVTRMNPVAEKLTGWTADEAAGAPLAQVFHIINEETRAAVENPVGRVLREGIVVGLANHTILISRDGSERPIADSAAPIRDDGNVVGVVLVFRDQTPERQAEEERVERLAAERANRAKDEFLAMLGHELRNPLAPIVTALQVMKLRDQGRLSKEREIINRQVRHMVRLVDDLLDLSRITRGKFELKHRRVDLCEVISGAVDMAGLLFEQRRQHLAVEVPKPPVWVLGDEARLVQVFVNLLSNAAKYTGVGGHIRVRVHCDPDVIVEVTDDGVGISPQLLPKIFDLFTQGGQSAGGLGIGLSLVRSLAQLQGGSVTAASAGPGKGSTFTVWLPLLLGEAARSEAAPAKPSPASSPTAERILLVDDNEDALLLLAEVLELSGHEVRTAHDGPSALQVVSEFQPEVAILDIGLPVMDGYELARRIRSQLGERTPPLIALTGYGQEADRAKSRNAGFQAHLVKPVEAQQLLDAIEQLHSR